MLFSVLTPTSACALTSCCTVLYGEFGITYSAWLPACICDVSAIIRMLMGLVGSVCVGFFGLGAANLPATWARMNET